MGVRGWPNPKHQGHAKIISHDTPQTTMRIGESASKNFSLNCKESPTKQTIQAGNICATIRFRHFVCQHCQQTSFEKNLSNLKVW